MKTVIVPLDEPLPVDRLVQLLADLVDGVYGLSTPLPEPPPAPGPLIRRFTSTPDEE